ncbi:hypothetical protein LguiB_034720 [Lonicera macranthoides]
MEDEAFRKRVAGAGVLTATVVESGDGGAMMVVRLRRFFDGLTIVVDDQLDETIISALRQQNRGVVILDESERLQSFKEVNGLSRNVLGALARRLNDGTSRKNAHHSIRDGEKIGQFNQPRFFPGLTPRRAQRGRVELENRTIQKKTKAAKALQTVPFSLDSISPEPTLSLRVRNFVHSLPDDIVLQQTRTNLVYQDVDSSIDDMCSVESPTIRNCVQSMPNPVLLSEETPFHSAQDQTNSPTSSLFVRRQNE